MNTFTYKPFSSKKEKLNYKNNTDIHKNTPMK